MTLGHNNLPDESVASHGASKEDGTITYVPPSHIPFFRSTLFQIMVVGMVFFCAPGMYNALSGLGAGGLATPFWANATAAAGYAFMAAMCIWGGVLVSKIGLRRSLWISSTGDIVYGGSLYVNSKYGNQWFLMVGSIFSGATDGLMYAVEGPIVTAYPEYDRRGKMLGLWVAMRSAAPIIGGAIIFGLNHDTDSSGAVSLKTYLVLIGIMCAGPFIALLLSHPSKVLRKDGKPIQFRKLGWTESTKEWIKVLATPEVLLLCPLMFTSWFSQSYTGTIQTNFFNVRTRSLTAFVVPFADIIAGYVTGLFLDAKRFSTSFKARAAFWTLISLNLLLWMWIAIVTKQLHDHQPTIDWTHGSWMGKLWVNLFVFEFCTMATQTALFWIISSLSDDMNVLSFLTGTLRGVECVGQAVAYALKSEDTNDWVSVGLNVGFIVFSIPFAWKVIRTIGIRDYIKEQPMKSLISGSVAPTQATVADAPPLPPGVTPVGEKDRVSEDLDEK